MFKCPPASVREKAKAQRACRGLPSPGTGYVKTGLCSEEFTPLLLSLLSVASQGGGMHPGRQGKWGHRSGPRGWASPKAWGWGAVLGVLVFCWVQGAPSTQAVPGPASPGAPVEQALPRHFHPHGEALSSPQPGLTGHKVLSRAALWGDTKPCPAFVCWMSDAKAFESFCNKNSNPVNTAVPKPRAKEIMASRQRLGHTT